MEISAPTTAVTVLPSSRARRWLPTRRSHAPAAPEPATQPVEEVTPALDSDAPITVTADEVALSAAPPAAPELAPLAAFGRWMADFADDTAPKAAPAPAQPVSSAAPLVTYSSSIGTPADSPAQEPAQPSGDSERVAQLTAELKALSDELETFRQRSAAERMHLLEELANARDARRAAETELAAVQAVLDAAERRLPAPRRGTLHAVS